MPAVRHAAASHAFLHRRQPPPRRRATGSKVSSFRSQLIERDAGSVAATLCLFLIKVTSNALGRAAGATLEGRALAVRWFSLETLLCLRLSFVVEYRDGVVEQDARLRNAFSNANHAELAELGQRPEQVEYHTALTRVVEVKAVRYQDVD